MYLRGEISERARGKGLPVQRQRPKQENPRRFVGVTQGKHVASLSAAAAVAARREAVYIRRRTTA